MIEKKSLPHHSWYKREACFRHFIVNSENNPGKVARPTSIMQVADVVIRER